MLSRSTVFPTPRSPTINRLLAARPLKRTIQNLVQNPLAKLILEGHDARSNDIVLG